MPQSTRRSRSRTTSWSAGSAAPTASRARCPSSRAPTSRSGASPRVPGSTRLRTAGPRTLTVAAPACAPGPAAGPLRGDRRPRRGRGGPRHRAQAWSTPPSAPEDPEEFYDHQLVGLARRDHRRRRRSASCAGWSTARAQDLLVIAYAGPRGAGARSSPRSCPRSTSPAAGSSSTTSPVCSTGASERCASTSSRSSRTTSRRSGCRCPARPRRAACSTCTSTTCATGPTTGTAPSTTRRTAGAPAW